MVKGTVLLTKAVLRGQGEAWGEKHGDVLFASRTKCSKKQAVEKGLTLFQQPVRPS